MVHTDSLIRSYIALQNNDRGEGPLQKYFLGERMHGPDASLFVANMYLAEDRVSGTRSTIPRLRSQISTNAHVSFTKCEPNTSLLAHQIISWELVANSGARWTLTYVKSAYATTDVPTRLPELISQRRRWLNGTLFAAVYALYRFDSLYRSAHSFLRIFWIHVEMVYQIANLLFNWFALGNYYIAFVCRLSLLPCYGLRLLMPVVLMIGRTTLVLAYKGLRRRPDSHQRDIDREWNT